MTLSWLKLNIDIFDNAKIKKIRRQSGGNDIFVVWIYILTLGMKCKRYGILEISDGLPYQIQDIADELNMSFDVVNNAMGIFEQFNMIQRVDGNTYEISNFIKKQSIDRIENIKTSARIRQARKRERDKLLISGNTQEEDKIREDKIREDKIREDKIREEGTRESRVTEEKKDDEQLLFKKRFYTTYQSVCKQVSVNSYHDHDLDILYDIHGEALTQDIITKACDITYNNFSSGKIKTISIKYVMTTMNNLIIRDDKKQSDTPVQSESDRLEAYVNAYKEKQRKAGIIY